MTERCTICEGCGVEIPKGTPIVAHALRCEAHVARRLLDALRRIADGYGADHGSRFCRDAARAAVDDAQAIIDAADGVIDAERSS